MAVDKCDVESFLYSTFSNIRRNGQGFVISCPFCGDGKGNKRRCHINYIPKHDEWIYHCFNGGCDESGSVQSLYAFMNNVTYKEADDFLNNKKYDSDKIKKRLNRKKEPTKDDKLVTKLDLDLSLCYTVKDNPEDVQGKKYIEYLKRFIYDRRIPTRYKPLVCFDGKYKNRFIIPVYDKNEMVYFQGRTIHSFMEPKYLNPDTPKEYIILNRGNFDRDKFIIITEALICAMNIGNQGTSCLGAVVSDDLLMELFKLTDKGVIVALDNPKIDESGYKNYVKLIEESPYARKIKYFFMPQEECKDINDICVRNPVSFLPQVYNFVLENSYSHFKAKFLIKSLKK